ncbi:MAG: DUF448 domain-containing protein [Sphingomicrobium sp.]
MRNPQNDTRTDNSGVSESERTCILTRRTATRDELVRLALGPDGQVAPDVRAKAPGRGAWIGVGRTALDVANAKGKLKGALTRAFKNQALAIPVDLGQRIEAALRQAVLDRLGLEARGGALLTGAERIEQAARAGQVHLLIHAADASDDGNRKLDQALRVGARVGGGPEAGLNFPENRSILSMALGRENVVHIALTEAAAARRVATAIARWRAFIDPDAGLDGADAGGPASTDAFENEGNA